MASQIKSIVINWEHHFLELSDPASCNNSAQPFCWDRVPHVRWRLTRVAVCYLTSVWWPVKSYTYLVMQSACTCLLKRGKVCRPRGKETAGNRDEGSTGSYCSFPPTELHWAIPQACQDWRLATTNLLYISLIYLLLLWGLEGVVVVFLQVGEEFSWDNSNWVIKHFT